MPISLPPSVRLPNYLLIFILSMFHDKPGILLKFPLLATLHQIILLTCVVVLKPYAVRGT